MKMHVYKHIYICFNNLLCSFVQSTSAHGVLSHLGPPVLYPLYNQPQDTEIYHENIRRHRTFRRRLAEHIRNLKLVAEKVCFCSFICFMYQIELLNKLFNFEYGYYHIIYFSRCHLKGTAFSLKSIFKAIYLNMLIYQPRRYRFQYRYITEDIVNKIPSLFICYKIPNMNII